MQNDIVRVLVAKVGLDGHDRGAKIIARSLRDMGMEVIYTGIRQTPQMVVEVAIQEDVDVIGLSSLSGAHMELFPQIMNGLKDEGMNDIVVVAGGIIPEEDREILMEIGLTGVFGPGSSMSEISEFIQEATNRHRRSISGNT